MNILAIETSTHASSAAVLSDNSGQLEITQDYQLAPRQHTTLIFEQMEKVLADSGLTLNSIDALSFGRGPGAFTGVRIAIGVIQGIAYAKDLPVAAVSSLAATAQGIYRLHGAEHILVANDARMNEIYMAGYTIIDGTAEECVSERVVNPQQLELDSVINSAHKDTRWFAAGSGWSEYQDELNKLQPIIGTTDTEFLVHAQDIAMLAYEMANKDQLVSAVNAQPVYLRDNVAKKKGER